jgi:hypothetical protein
MVHFLCRMVCIMSRSSASCDKVLAVGHFAPRPYVLRFTKGACFGTSYLAIHASPPQRIAVTDCDLHFQPYCNVPSQNWNRRRHPEVDLWPPSSGRLWMKNMSTAPLTMASRNEILIRCSDMKPSHQTSLFPRTWSPARSRALPYSFALVLRVPHVLTAP